MVSLLHLCGFAVTTLWLRGERVAKVTLSPLKCFSNRVTVGLVQAMITYNIFRKLK